jgi:hypothetical protein
VKGAFPFIFLLLQRPYAGVGRSSTSNPANPASRKKSGAQVGAPDKSDQLSTAGGPSQGEVPGREHGVVPQSPVPECEFSGSAVNQQRQ